MRWLLDTHRQATRNHAQAHTPWVPFIGAHSEEKMPNLTWVERENMEVREKNMKVEIVR